MSQSLHLEDDGLTFQDLVYIYKKSIAFVPQGEQVPGNTEGERQFKTALQTEADAGRAGTG
ncbi:hypothetical protein GYMLUDRAFT_707457 [Collybiopsis luxurians FD-317 M1]|uniref:Uncharacterized protein n=1 Tax=Collybiopsis luxurians FD-317 M1 TaxID=944289 RepID=A0A0D0C6J7_9AGAR|nr:hypothetical protein GYMLUDRAFT_707457 [Collybiopsis luxurians FD-317 M1]